MNLQIWMKARILTQLSEWSGSCGESALALIILSILFMFHQTALGSQFEEWVGLSRPLHPTGPAKLVPTFFRNFSSLVDTWTRRVERKKHKVCIGSVPSPLRSKGMWTQRISLECVERSFFTRVLFFIQLIMSSRAVRVKYSLLLFTYSHRPEFFALATLMSGDKCWKFFSVVLFPFLWWVQPFFF